MQNSNEIPQPLSEQQVCKILKCSPTTLYRLRKAGKLQHQKQGKQFVYSHSDIITFLEETSHKAIVPEGKTATQPSLSAAPSDHCVYFILGVETHRIKIGWTAHTVDSRLQAFKVGSPDELVLLGTMPGTRKCERQLHAKFAENHVRGEWFRVSEELARFIVDVCSQHQQPDDADITRLGQYI